MQHLHFTKKGWLPALAFLIFFIPRLISLGSDISNYDASYWYPRMEKFTRNLTKGEYQLTYQQYHPGVTLLWLSGTSKQAFEGLFEAKYHYNPNNMAQQFVKLNFASILPLVFVISLLGALSAWIISKIINIKFALIFSLALSFEPFFLGISKFLHLSALGGMLSFTSFLCIYYYYNKQKTNSWFYLSAILISLGILTKIDSAIGLVINLSFIFYSELISSSWKFHKQVFYRLIKYLLVSFATFYFLFPAMWVAPFTTTRRMLQEGIVDTAFTSEGENTLSGIKKLFYFEFIFIRSLPTTFILLITGILISIYKSIKKKLDSTDKFVIISGLIYMFVNVAILVIPDKSKDRYITNFEPSLIIISTYAFYHILKLKNFIKYPLITLTISLYLSVLYRYFPVYSYYFTDLIGGAQAFERAGVSIKNRGEYYAQAAQYINENDENPTERNVVLTHREQVRTFKPFFYGNVYANPKFMPDRAKADYIISRREMDNIVPKDKCQKVQNFGPKNPFGYEVLILYKCQGIDNQFKDFAN